MSPNVLVSPLTRLLADDRNATISPLAEIEALSEAPSPCTLSVEGPVRRNVKLELLLTKTSWFPTVSPLTKSVASDWNAMSKPSPEIAAEEDARSACADAEVTDARTVCGVGAQSAPKNRRCTKISFCPLVSPTTRFVAVDSNAILVASSLIEAEVEAAFAWVVAESTDTRVVVFAGRQKAATRSR